jgi:hypothetical protein
MEGFILEKIVSGGQIGADKAALRAAKTLGYQTGGWAPKGFKTLDGPCPTLGNQFGLKELREPDYPTRSKRNVDESDATIAFRFHSSAGTNKTIGYCITKEWAEAEGEMDGSHAHFSDNVHKPVLVLFDFQTPSAVICRFLCQHHVKVLNVAGNSSLESDPKWETNVEAYLCKVLPMKI